MTSDEKKARLWKTRDKKGKEVWELQALPEHPCFIEKQPSAGQLGRVLGLRKTKCIPDLRSDLNTAGDGCPVTVFEETETRGLPGIILRMFRVVHQKEACLRCQSRERGKRILERAKKLQAAGLEYRLASQQAEREAHRVEHAEKPGSGCIRCAAQGRIPGWSGDIPDWAKDDDVFPG